MHIKLFASAVALAFATPILAQEPTQESRGAPAEEAEQQEQSQFIGRYDGSSFETAMGMVIRADGTFEWGLSVGALDASAEGTWFEEDDTVVFVSDPKPLPPEFTWAGIEQGESGPFLRVVWAGTDKPFRSASVSGLCANGQRAFGYLGEGHWSPGDKCGRVEKLEFRMQSYDVRPEVFDMSTEGRVTPGATIRFEFHRNDLGVANFDGSMGQFVDGQLVVQGPLGAMALRKMTPPTD